MKNYRHLKGQHIPLPEEKKQQIITLFKTEENNTVAAISKATGIKESKVSQVINKYLKPKIKKIIQAR